jgi:5'-nucleotidase
MSNIELIRMPNYLLTNDDGIDAPGIAALQQAVDARGTIVAPREHQSGCGHQVTTHQPISIDTRSNPYAAVTTRTNCNYAIGGTPADCIRIAIQYLQLDIDYVLSGINAGGNLGVDAYISGTVAAVREAAILGIPGIAISQYKKSPHPIDWEISTKLARHTLDRLFSLPLPPKSFWNVNLPYCASLDILPELIFCEPSCDPLPTDYQLSGDTLIYSGVYRDRLRMPGTDVDVCFGGNIAITQLKV